MKKYVIVIEETVSEDFEVTAESEQEALEIAEQKYNSGEFVLEPGFLQETKFGIVDEDENQIKWVD